MELVQIEETWVQGLLTRTCNADEMNPETAKIGPLWERFFDKLGSQLLPESHAYGVYFDFKDGDKGRYAVLAGTNQLSVDCAEETLSQVTIQAGQYLCFKGRGKIPQVVFETWKKVWDYFETSDADHQRAYKTDFEFYPSENEVEIYISIMHFQSMKDS